VSCCARTRPVGHHDLLRRALADVGDPGLEEAGLAREKAQIVAEACAARRAAAAAPCRCRATALAARDAVRRMSHTTSVPILAARLHQRLGPRPRHFREVDQGQSFAGVARNERDRGPEEAAAVDSPDQHGWIRAPGFCAPTRGRDGERNGWTPAPEGRSRAGRERAAAGRRGRHSGSRGSQGLSSGRRAVAERARQIGGRRRELRLLDRELERLIEDSLRTSSDDVPEGCGVGSRCMPARRRAR